MKVFLAFVLGIILAVGVIWIMSGPAAKQDVEQIGQELGEGMNQAKQGIKDAVDDVDATELKQDIKEAGQKVADKTEEIVSDATITASVKAKLAAAADISALSIDVDTTDGVVTLSGKVDSAEEVTRSVNIASTVTGVKQVLSTLQVKTSQPDS